MQLTTSSKRTGPTLEASVARIAAEVYGRMLPERVQTLEQRDNETQGRLDDSQASIGQVEAEVSSLSTQLAQAVNALNHWAGTANYSDRSLLVMRGEVDELRLELARRTLR